MKWDQLCSTTTYLCIELSFINENIFCSNIIYWYIVEEVACFGLTFSNSSFKTSHSLKSRFGVYNRVVFIFCRKHAVDCSFVPERHGLEASLQTDFDCPHLLWLVLHHLQPLSVLSTPPVDPIPCQRVPVHRPLRPATGSDHSHW